MMNNGWYHHWVPGATIDDQMWHQALVVDRVLESLRGKEHGSSNALMWELLQQGILDMSAKDKPWDGATCSMRYSATLGCHLWGLLASERTRVISPLCSSVPWNLLEK